MKIKDIVEARMSAAVKLQRAFEREQSKSTASRDRADQAKAQFEKEWKAKQEKEKKGVEEGWKSNAAAAALAAANLLSSPAQAAEEPVKPITIAYVTIDGEVKKFNLGDKFASSAEAEKFISRELDKQGLQGYQLEIKRGYPKQKNEDAAGVGIITKQNTTADVDKNTPKKNLRAFRL